MNSTATKLAGRARKIARFVVVYGRCPFANVYRSERKARSNARFISGLGESVAIFRVTLGGMVAVWPAEKPRSL